MKCIFAMKASIWSSFISRPVTLELTFICDRIFAIVVASVPIASRLRRDAIEIRDRVGAAALFGSRVDGAEKIALRDAG
jgi:hypothetical protein